MGSRLLMSRSSRGIAGEHDGLSRHPVGHVGGSATVTRPDAPAMRHRFTDVLLRRNNRWLIAQARAYNLQTDK
jgi:hypothetical protein